MAAGGYGAHVRTVPYNKLVISLKVFFASEWFWATSVASFRLAILLLYIDIFRKRVFFWAAISTGLLVVLYWAASILTIALLCRPINVNWNRTIIGTCGDLRKTEFASAGFNMGIDLLVVLLPMPVVWTLQMSKEKKFGVTAAFTLGMMYLPPLYPPYLPHHPYKQAIDKKQNSIRQPRPPHPNRHLLLRRPNLLRHGQLHPRHSRDVVRDPRSVRPHTRAITIQHAGAKPRPGATSQDAHHRIAAELVAPPQIVSGYTARVAR